MDKPHRKKPAPKKSSSPEADRGKASTADTPANVVQDRQPGDKSFPIVGIGASAGGLEAFTQLLKALPADTGMGFVVVQHLAPKHESVLTEILSRATKMPVTEVRDGMPVEPDHVYVIPPDTNMAILHGRLNLMPRANVIGQHMPIDYFLRTLAQDQGASAIGVILSGTASDGAQGLAAIKGEGGITFAQEPESAKYDGMPRAAIAAGVVDFILQPEAIARELAGISRHPYVAPRAVKPPPAQLPEDALHKIFIMLRAAFGVDFTYYKHTTIRRRIMRRMVLHKIEGLDNYIKHLQNNSAELNSLYQDILITVTNFFRDAEEFEALKEKVFPDILKNRAPDAPIRVWAPGCSTGEEAYSIAICWVEFLKEAATSTPIQIFATDVNDRAIEKARAAIYPESIKADVSPERLRRFFTKIDGGYQINKSIRDMCIFARQAVTKDPPFSKMDLISCRNVLIYLGPVLQKKVLPLFHYALSAPGFLLLGTSETVGAFSDLFTLVDKKHKIYAKKPTAVRPAVDFVARDYVTEKADIGRVIRKPSEIDYAGFDIRKETDRIILNKYSPAGITINENLEILQFRGHTGHYLEPTPGVASLNLLKMVREDLAHDVRAAIQDAKKKGANIRKEGLRFRHNGQIKFVNLDVMPVNPPLSKERFFLVLFEEAEPPIQAVPEKGDSGKTAAGKKKSEARARQEISSSEVARLRQELDATKAFLQATIEEHDATNEELRSASEEIWSANEELQSTNEELETAKEELQSANEELTTLNEELQNRNVELNQLNNDLNNLFSGINIPIVMLGQDMRIRRFTSPSEKALNLIPTDIGRPISDIKPNVEISDLERMVLNVVETLESVEQEVQDRQGYWYSLRVRPYRTADNKIDGVVMALLDIDELKSNRRQLQETRDHLEAILGTIPPLLALDAELRVKRANRSFYQAFQLTPEETVDRSIYDLGDGEWNIPALRAMLAELTPERASVRGFELAHDFKRVGRKTLLINAGRVDGGNDISPAIFLVIQDLAEFKRA